MTREEFYCFINETLNNALSDVSGEIELSLEDGSANGKNVKFLILMSKKCAYAPAFNLDKYYEQYLTGTKPEEFIKGMEGVARKHVIFMQSNGHLSLDKYDEIKDKVVLKLISNHTAEEILQNPETAPYIISFRFFHAMFYVAFSHQDGFNVLIPVRKSNLDAWKTTENDLLDAAFLKQEKDGVWLLPLACNDSSSEQFQEQNIWGRSELGNTLRNVSLFCLTNQNRCNGASMIMNPRIQKGIYNLIGSDYYVLPSSIHEMMIVPTGYRNTDELSAMVRYVNETEIAECDRLSNEVLYYNPENGLVSAAEYEAVKGEIERNVKEKALGSVFIKKIDGTLCPA